jgi:hypothetical protein
MVRADMTAQTRPPWFDEYLDAERDRPAVF